LLAGAIVEDRDATANAFFVSSGRGSTWSSALLMPHSVDPSCAIGNDDVVYAASVHDSMPTGAPYLNVQRSVDSGRTWTEAVVHSSARSLDRPERDAVTRPTSKWRRHDWARCERGRSISFDGDRQPHGFSSGVDGMEPWGNIE
jgi:hypothetical protein